MDGFFSRFVSCAGLEQALQVVVLVELGSTDGQEVERHHLDALSA
jgi:hypothetical protein